MNFDMDFNGDSGNGGGNFSGGGGSGGGFGNDGGGSQQQRARKSYDEQTLIPVTCHMVLEARPDRSGGGEDRLQLPDGRMLSHVSLVAAVRSAAGSSTSVTYEVEDGTGLVTVKEWTDDSEPVEMRHLREMVMRKDNAYVKIIGQIKEYEERKMVVAQSVRLIQTGDELTHHMIHVVLSAEKHRKANTIVPPAAFGSNATVAPVRSAPMGASLGGGGARGDATLRDRICAVIRQDAAGIEGGINISAIANRLELPESQIRKMTDILQSEGQIYTTVNENFVQLAL